jgi:putative transposase
MVLQPRSPNLNAFAERWVRSIKSECLSKLILFGEGSLRQAVGEYLEHYHHERDHKGNGNLLLFPETTQSQPHRTSAVRCREHIRGLLKYYSRAA